MKKTNAHLHPACASACQSDLGALKEENADPESRMVDGEGSGDTHRLSEREASCHEPAAGELPSGKGPGMAGSLASMEERLSGLTSSFAAPLAAARQLPTGRQLHPAQPHGEFSVWSHFNALDTSSAAICVNRRMPLDGIKLCVLE